METSQPMRVLLDLKFLFLSRTLSSFSFSNIIIDKEQESDKEQEFDKEQESVREQKSVNDQEAVKDQESVKDQE